MLRDVSSELLLLTKPVGAFPVPQPEMARMGANSDPKPTTPADADPDAVSHVRSDT